MPGLIAVNNTYTANTPEGVRECLHFLERRGLRIQGGARASDVFRSFPISIVYGYGSAAPGQLVTVGDDLDIIPTQWDQIRRRRWWRAPSSASKQMLLPFDGHDRVRITHINRHSDATDIVIQIGQDRYSQVSLSAPRLLNAPGPYTVRAIRIHNVDGSETVPPMRSIRDESCQNRIRASMEEVASGSRYINGDFADLMDSPCQESGPIDSVDWSSPVAESNPCGEEVAPPRPPRTRPRRPHDVEPVRARRQAEDRVHRYEVRQPSPAMMTRGALVEMEAQTRVVPVNQLEEFHDMSAASDTASDAGYFQTARTRLGRGEREDAAAQLEEARREADASERAAHVRRTGDPRLAAREGRDWALIRDAAARRARDEEIAEGYGSFAWSLGRTSTYYDT